MMPCMNWREKKDIDTMIETLKVMLSGNPILLLFLVLAIGFLIGGIRFGAFQLGPVAGVWEIGTT